MKKIVIVGAGITGLTMGYELSRNGFDVTLIEKEEKVGGLARTFIYDGFIFDIGPHRFHTDDKTVLQFIHEILKGEAIEIPRKSGVRMFGRYHDWPLRASIFISMPIFVMANAAKDLIFKKRYEGNSFEVDMLNRYGETLYHIFFRPYTEKFIFHDPKEIHRDWGRAGVDRAVIDKNVKTNNLINLLKSTLLPKPVNTLFIYPEKGVYLFPEKLAEDILKNNGKIKTDALIEEIKFNNNKITGLKCNSKWMDFDYIVWTAPLVALNKLLGIDGIDLKYLSTICYNIKINKEPKVKYQWCYYGGDEIFCRISTPVVFSSAAAPPGKSGLCVELPSIEGDARWSHPEVLKDEIVRDLVMTETIDSPDDVIGIHIEKIPNSYPIYKLNYFEELSKNMRLLDKYKNLMLAGRCGAFWYNNMDHSIGQGLNLSRRIVAGEEFSTIKPADRQFWAEVE